MTDATVSVFSSLPSSQQSALLRDLFSTSGIDFSLMRHTIASSDLSTDVYTYDNSSTPDIGLSKFSLGREGDAMLAWMVSAKATNPAIKLLGSVWSPPGWMKLNGVESGITLNNNLNPRYAGSFAQYFVKYIQAFASKGVAVDAITIQNEPLNSQSGYPTMYVSAENSTNLIQNFVGPALKTAGLSTEVWAYDHNTGTYLLMPFPSPPPPLLPVPVQKLTIKPSRRSILPPGRPRWRPCLRQHSRMALLRLKQ